MSDFTASDSGYMARAMRLAARGRYSAHPNPMVGCVVVVDDAIVGEGWHESAGQAHAEINALGDAGSRAKGATVYITLEPCAHHGRTPPCADALIEAEVAEVVVAMADPFPEVRGSGLAALRAAGIRVREGLMQAEAERLNAGFLCRVVHALPFLRVKVAASLDGAIAMDNGQSQWITGPQARADVQRLRARSGAILTGIGTVLADDPALTVRDPELNPDGRQPLRAVLDSKLRLPLSSTMLDQPGHTLVYCIDDAGKQALVDAGAEVVRQPGSGNYVDAREVLRDLASREVNDVLVEAGPAVAGHLLEQKLVNELVIYQAPHIMGSRTKTMFLTPRWPELADRLALDVIDRRNVGADVRITARIHV